MGLRVGTTDLLTFDVPLIWLVSKPFWFLEDEYAEWISENGEGGSSEEIRSGAGGEIGGFEETG